MHLALPAEMNDMFFKTTGNGDVAMDPSDDEIIKIVGKDVWELLSSSEQQDLAMIVARWLEVQGYELRANDQSVCARPLCCVHAMHVDGACVCMNVTLV